MSLGTKIVATIAGTLAGVPASDIQTLMEGDPRDLHKEARKLLGLTLPDVVMIRQIKRLTPTAWSLQYLGIPAKVYSEYQQSLRRQASGKEEFTEIKLQNDVKKVKENMPQIDGYLNFYKHLVTVCQPIFKHTTGWRFIPPVMHITAARDILNGVLAQNSVTLLDAFRVSMYIYYGIFNAIMGTKVSKTLQQVA
jgi:hypothetical protein